MKINGVDISKIDSSEEGSASKQKAKKKTSKGLTIFLVIVALAIATFVIIVSHMRLSLDEIKAQLDEQMQQHVQYFDESYGVEGTVCIFDYSKVSVAWHPFHYDQGYLDTYGHVTGEIDVILASLAAYEYLEKETYSVDDVRHLDVMKLTLKNGTDDLHEKGLELDNYSCTVEIGDMTYLDRNGNMYKAVHVSDSECVLVKNGETIFKVSPPSSGGSGSCPWCNGTGAAKYNYGGSDLEAILSGHAPFSYGTCGSCGGTGKAK